MNCDDSRIREIVTVAKLKPENSSCLDGFYTHGLCNISSLLTSGQAKWGLAGATTECRATLDDVFYTCQKTFEQSITKLALLCFNEMQMSGRVFWSLAVKSLNPKGTFLLENLRLDSEIKNGFCISVLNRLIQGLLDHSASKELKNLLWIGILQFLWCTMIPVILNFQFY